MPVRKLYLYYFLPYPSNTFVETYGPAETNTFDTDRLERWDSSLVTFLVNAKLEEIDAEEIVGLDGDDFFTVLQRITSLGRGCL